MLKLKEQIVRILDASAAKKSVAAEADLILYHFFREKTKTPGAVIATREITDQALEIAAKRATGIPLQHLLGYQFFYEHEYRVNPHVLIPRPETEILVQAAIAWAEETGARRFAELGLGSGAISGEILFACKALSGVASEISTPAIQMAQENLKRVLGENWNERLQILQPSDLSAAFADFRALGPFDLIVSNPPYVSRDDEIEPEVLQYEPHLALFPDAQSSGVGPNFFYGNFLNHAKPLLSEGSAAFFEIPHERAAEIARLFRMADFTVDLIPDLTGRSRVLKCTF